MSDSEDRASQIFEIAAAVLLGIAAVSSAWCGHQSGLWGGNCLTSYTEAGKKTTAASTIYQETSAETIRDSSLDIMAKQIIAEASAIKDNADLRDTKFDIARYLYTQQISDDAYKSLKLPAEALSEDEAAWNALPEDALLASLEIDLDEKYWDEQFEPAEKMFAEAEKDFAEGRRANGVGDQFGFVNVLLTVAMFFLGVSLVFKTKARWGLLGAGVIVLIVSDVMMFSFESAGTGLPSGPDPAPAAAPEGVPGAPPAEAEE